MDCIDWIGLDRTLKNLCGLDWIGLGPKPENHF